MVVADKGSPQSAIPDKLYFKIGEVADLVGVQTHVLRYWEKEVPSIRPQKSDTNQRRYRRKDVESFREIRRLLYEERYTLAGAKRRLLGTDMETPTVDEVVDFPPEPGADHEKLGRLRSGLEGLVRLSGEDP